MSEKNLKKWQAGQSGNPRGRPLGQRNSATVLAAALVSKQAEAVAQKVVTAAMGGDMRAALFILERFLPKDRLLVVNLPATDTASGIAQGQEEILQAVGRGEITPAEGNHLSAVLEGRRRAIETQEIEQRISALEQSLTTKKE